MIEDVSKISPFVECPCECGKMMRVKIFNCGCEVTSDCKGDDSYIVTECKKHSYDYCCRRETMNKDEENENEIK